jgi:quinol monooxygenase YgiN
MRAALYDGWMLIAHINVHVKPDSVEAFLQATLANARESVKEPGIARFDVLQRADDPTRFIFLEVYRTAEGAVRHKETAHYQTWRDTVEQMMAEPRARATCANIFPGDEGW